MRIFYLLSTTQICKTSDLTANLYNYYNNSKNSNTSFEQYDLRETTQEPIKLP